MPDFGFKIIPKDFFFDRPAVMNAVKKGKLRALSKGGAFVRTRARSKLNKTAGKKAIAIVKEAREAGQNIKTAGKTTAASGKSPYKHAGQLREFLYFAFDADHESTLVGPTKFKAGVTPALMEFGGEEILTDAKGKKYTAHYKGDHKFMGPSLQEEVAAGTISEAWAGAVRGD